MVRSMQKTVAWGVSAVLFAGLVGGYYLWRAIATRDVPVVLEEPAERKPAPRVEPAIRYPIERVPIGGRCASRRTRAVARHAQDGRHLRLSLSAVPAGVSRARLSERILQRSPGGSDRRHAVDTGRA